MEEWKTAFENYEISNFGNCRNEDKIINGSVNNRGYRYFQLQRNGKRLNLLFHHMVAKCFIGERPENLVIDHIDRNKLNNNVENLRYVSQEINSQNHIRYRNDIQTKDKNERKRIFKKEYDIRRGRNKGIRRQKGTGSIQQRENNTWRAIIIINNIKYDKTFSTKEEAEKFLNSIVENI